MTELSLTSEFRSPLVLGLGFFDCVHTGHRALIQTVIDTAAQNGCTPCIATFSNNPYRMFNPDAKVINLYLERLSMFSGLGIGHVLPFQFDAEFKKTDRKDFLDALTSKLNIKTFVCGYDYLFGSKGQGDAEYLKTYGKERGIGVIVVQPIMLSDERVSSTMVKECIERGNIEKANRLLSAPFFIDGLVTEGSGTGRKIGFPTANITFKKSKLVPPDGVYQTKTVYNGKEYRSVTHIGSRPTVADTKRTVETHLADFSGNLYGKEIRVVFLRRLRDVQKFDSLSALSGQIAKDLKA